MTRDIHISTEITSEAAFEAVLAAAIEAAIENDVDVEGPWQFETGGSIHHWEVMVDEIVTDD
jgi:hypothetical protein